MGIKDVAARLRHKAQAKTRHIHRVHHFADMAYLATTFIEHHVLHQIAVSSLIAIVASTLIVGEGGEA